MQHYNNFHEWIKQIKKYSLRSKDKQQSYKIQYSNLQVLNACYVEFAFQNQDVVRKEYNINLSHKYCKCNNYDNIYKYM